MQLMSLQQLWKKLWETSKQDLIGILITVSVHLAVIIVLLCSVITPALVRESRIELDFSELEELERLQKELEFKKDVNSRLNELLAQNGLDPINATEEMKSVAVNRSSTSDLLAENARIQQDIKESLERRVDGSISFEEVPQIEEEQIAEYNGASVVSYNLGGRKASHMPIPAYKCYSGGEVTVIIEVNPQGDVIGARIKDDVSANDSCLRRCALLAAKRSRFSVDSGAPAKQRGDIVYSFIAQ